MSSQPDAATIEPGLARLAERLGAAAIRHPGRAPLRFSADTLLVPETEPALLAALHEAGGVPRAMPRPALPEGLAWRGLRPPPALVALDFPRGLAGRMRAEGLEALRGIRGCTASSESAAALAGFVMARRAAGQRLALDLLGEPAALPLTPILDKPAAPPTLTSAWPAYRAARLPQAWRLLESARVARNLGRPLLAVIDQGFWLGADGSARVPGSDFANTGAMFFDFPAMERVRVIADTGFHGQQVASVAAAPVGDGRGTAGAGGTIAQVALCRAPSYHLILRALVFVTQTGFDVANISLLLPFDADVLDDMGWGEHFAWAEANGLFVVAAAGDGGADISASGPLPASRTPGVLTVGALDAAGQPAGFSNRGAAVALWAPGVAVQTGPTPDQPDGGVGTGTSFAAPIVAGVAAMLRAVDPGASPARLRALLLDHAAGPAGAATRRLDAQAALTAALGSPPWPDLLQNTKPGAALPLVQQPDGALGPIGGLRAIAGPRTEFWSFQVEEVRQVVLRLNGYASLADLTLALSCDDPDIAAFSGGEILATTEVTDATENGWALLGLVLGPGLYRVGVASLARLAGRPALSAYALRVELGVPGLGTDPLEDGEDAAGVLDLAWADAGVFQRSLHGGSLGFPGPVETDAMHIAVPPAAPGRLRRLTIGQTDERLTVEAFDAAGARLTRAEGVRRWSFDPPPGQSVLLRVSSARQTRYTLRMLGYPDPTAVPKPFQALPELPAWWKGPAPWRLDRPALRFWLDPAERPEGLAFTAPKGVRLVARDAAGQVVASAERAPDGRLVFAPGVLGAGPVAIEARAGRKLRGRGAMLGFAVPAGLGPA